MSTAYSGKFFEDFETGDVRRRLPVAGLTEAAARTAPQPRLLAGTGA